MTQVTTPPGYPSLLYVIDQLRSTALVSDEEGEMTNSLQELAEWVSKAALQAAPAQPAKVVGTVLASPRDHAIYAAGARSVQPVNQVLVDALEKIANETRNIGSAHILARAALAQAQAQPAQGLTDIEIVRWLALQGEEFSCRILQDQPGDGDYYVSGAFHSGQGKTFREACIAAIQKGQQS